MLYWAVVFLIIAIVAAILGFGVIGGVAATIAKVLFIVFLILLVLSLIFGWRGGALDVKRKYLRRGCQFSRRIAQQC